MQRNTTSAPPHVFARVESLSMKETDKKIGAGNEARTRDLNLGKVALYQLSYVRLTPGARTLEPDVRENFI